MKTFQPTDLKTYRLKGQADAFIQAYSTQTAQSSKLAFVDLKGQIVATCYQIRLSGNETILVLNARFFERLLAHLNPFLTFYEVALEPSGHEACFVWDLLPGEKEPQDTWTVREGAGQIWVGTSFSFSNLSTIEQWNLFRLHSFVPLQGIDFDQTLLLNIFETEYVSFEKGCYLGQEIIARVHYKGHPPKKMIVCDEDACTVEEKARMTSKAPDPATGKIIGFLLKDR